MRLKFHVGDSGVWDQADERHTGRIDAIHNSAFADITWETGWRSLGIPIADLRKNGAQGRVVQQYPAERIK
jgi:hypothetical protein